MSTHKFFLKYYLQDNHWFGYSSVTPIDDWELQNRKIVRKYNNPDPSVLYTGNDK